MQTGLSGAAWRPSGGTTTRCVVDMAPHIFSRARRSDQVAIRSNGFLARLEIGIFNLAGCRRRSCDAQPRRHHSFFNPRHLRSTAVASWVVQQLSPWERGCDDSTFPRRERGAPSFGGTMRRLTLDEMYDCAERVSRAAQTTESDKRHRDKKAIAEAMIKIIEKRREACLRRN